MSTRKPGDETLSGAPSFEDQKKDTFATGPNTSNANLQRVGAEMAPEASQGAWRERAFTPRSVLAPDEVIQQLESALRTALSSANHPRVAFDEVRTAWMPILRQALEQAGGDGIDAWLWTLLDTPREATCRLFEELGKGLVRLKLTRELAGFEEEALKLVDVVLRAVTADKPQKLSFKQMEKQLEGKLEVHELLRIRGADDAELARRLTEIGSTLESIREQLRALPGKQPDGMYSNFTRLKYELKVIHAEQKRRKHQQAHTG